MAGDSLFIAHEKLTSWCAFVSPQQTRSHQGSLTRGTSLEKFCGNVCPAQGNERDYFEGIKSQVTNCQLSYVFMIMGYMSGQHVINRLFLH